MQNQTIVPGQIISKTRTFDFNNYTLNVTGDPTRNQRVASIRVPILGDSGQRIDVFSMQLTGVDFNVFWETFTSDKQIVAAVMAKVGSTQDLTAIQDSIVNVIPQTKP